MVKNGTYLQSKSVALCGWQVPTKNFRTQGIDGVKWNKKPVQGCKPIDQYSHEVLKYNRTNNQCEPIDQYGYRLPTKNLSTVGRNMKMKLISSVDV